MVCLLFTSKPPIDRINDPDVQKIDALDTSYILAEAVKNEVWVWGQS
jgi:hypothetical protein